MAAKVVRVVVLLVLLCVLGYVIWMRLHDAQNADPEDAAAAQEDADRKEEATRGSEAREAGEKLKAMKLIVGIRADDPKSKNPPVYNTLNCNGKKLGDEGFALIGKCFTLQSVTLIDTDVSDLRAKNLAGLTRLESLNILRTGHDKDAGTVGDAGLQCLASMPRLTGLILDGMNVGDDGLKIIGRCGELGTLSLGKTQITDAGLPALRGLKKLQWLMIADTAVADAGVAKLEGLSSLKELTLRGTKVTSKGRSALLKMYPQLKID